MQRNTRNGATGHAAAAKISRRLRAVAELVPTGARTADVGTHHGRLPLFLLASGRVDGCIATELTPARFDGPATQAGLEVRFGDGLATLDPEDGLDVIVVSGVGARTMVDILGSSQLRALAVRRLVLQPQAEWAVIRRWLAESGFRLVEERLVDERGRFYTVLAAEPARDAAGQYCHPRLTMDDLYEAGPLLVRSGDPTVRRFWDARIVRLERILRSAGPEPGRDRVRAAADRARRVRGVLGGSPLL